MIKLKNYEVELEEKYVSEEYETTTFKYSTFGIRDSYDISY